MVIVRMLAWFVGAFPIGLMFAMARHIKRGIVAAASE